jgi:hypothetical protein
MYRPIHIKVIDSYLYRGLSRQALRAPGVRRLPQFLDNWHMKVVRFSALYTGRLYSHKTFLVLISVRG